MYSNSYLHALWFAICMYVCAERTVAAFWVCLCLCTKNTHAIHGMQTLCLVVYMFCLFLMYFFYLHAFLLLPCVTTPVLSWTSPRGYRRQPKSRKRRCVKKKERQKKNMPFFFTIYSMSVFLICVTFISSSSYHVKWSFRSGCLGSVRAS